MNEFLFYANMVYIYWSVLQLYNVSASYHKVQRFIYYIISATNLILGCNCCFYDGFNVIGRTWIQFVVVTYLWTIAGLIIWACRKFAWMSKLSKHNAIHVLATIFILSHTSTSLAILHAISGAYLDYPSLNGTTTNHRVLLYDGNVPYFSKQHFPLFITSCIFAVFSLGFLFILLFVQPLQKYSHLRLLRWVNKLKPLLDAYTCPHILKPNCRFWNGYLLLARTILYIIFATNLGRDYHKSLDALSITCLILIGTLLLFGGVYTKPHLNILSSIHIVNLGVLSVIVRDNYPKKEPLMRELSVASVSLVSSSLAVFIWFVTIGYYLYKQLRSFDIPKCLRSLCAFVRRKREERKRNKTYETLDSYPKEDDEEERLYVSSSSTSTSTSELCIHSSVPPLSSQHYREPQLMDYDSI